MKAYRREPTIEDILIGLAGLEQLFTGWTDPLVCEQVGLGQKIRLMHRSVYTQPNDAITYMS